MFWGRPAGRLAGLPLLHGVSCCWALASRLPHHLQQLDAGRHEAPGAGDWATLGLIGLTLGLGLGAAAWGSAWGVARPPEPPQSPTWVFGGDAALEAAITVPSLPTRNFSVPPHHRQDHLIKGGGALWYSPWRTLSNSSKSAP